MTHINPIKTQWAETVPTSFIDKNGKGIIAVGAEEILADSGRALDTH